MMKFFELYIGAIFMWMIFYLIGRILFEENAKIKFFRLTIYVLIFALILSAINMTQEVLRGVVKIFCIYSLFCIYYRLIFKKSYSKIIISSLILYLCLFAAEVIFAVIASLILNNFHDSIGFLKNTIIVNASVSILELIIVKLSKNLLVPLIKNSNFDIKSNFILISVILIAIALLIFKIPVSKWSFDIEFLITMIIALCFFIIAIYLLKQRADIEKTTAMYQQLVDYSDITNNLLEDYRVISHEQKNQLLIIRSMIEESNKELIDYLDNLLDKKVGIKYEWIEQLNHLPLSGLKGLINYKLIEMESYGIITNIFISKEIAKTKIEKLSTKQKDNLYSIMGVYLDNAMQAAGNSNKKEISLEIYKENKEIVLVLANTYSGKIELDKIDTYGYTTKGKNHGVGLHIVKKIVEEEEIFSQTRNLFQEYYVQELRIKLSNTKNK